MLYTEGGAKAAFKINTGIGSDGLSGCSTLTLPQVGSHYESLISGLENMPTSKRS
jgi:hypothetical protein